ncbi:hypothetical protein Mal33_02610 [Rosistilla oblonga]|uniref:Uncharacterized protein n=1 Tax=Rosistilla oblonga TaxID=2527990 RepID=A0A518IMJ3_9BACT|nr:hypothetical protein Mal33_02610 [Rosistilla oblonga]
MRCNTISVAVAFAGHRAGSVHWMHTRMPAVVGYLPQVTHCKVAVKAVAASVVRAVLLIRWFAFVEEGGLSG